VFDKLRQTLEDLVNRMPSTPEDRRDRLARMKDTLVQARVGLSDLRDGVAAARKRLAVEQRELETVRRRKRLAADVGDAETVAVAERFEALHAERVAVVARKVEVQEEELALAEREVAAMSGELRAAMSGVEPPSRAAGEMGAPDEGGADGAGAADPDLEGLRDELDGLGRARARAARDAAAAARLEELKRKMGK
jgi:hypothetical protein